MPRNRSRSNRDIHDRVVRVPFHDVVTISTPSTNGLINISPLSFSRLSAMCDGFEMYRFAALKYRIRARGGAATGGARSGPQAVAYLAGVTDNVPTSAAAMMEALTGTYLGAGEQVPSSWAVVNFNMLKGYFSWYKTVAGSADPAEEVQGILAGAGNSGDTAIDVEVVGVCEFKNSVDPSATPMERAKAERIRERERILKLLSENPSPTSPTTPSRAVGKGGVSA